MWLWGGSSKSETNTAEPIIVPSNFSLQENAKSASLTTISISESHIQIGDLVSDIFLLNQNFVKKNETVCSNGGFSSLEHLDNDNTGTLSVDDEVNITFSQCYVAAIDDVLDGVLRLSITTMDMNNNRYSGTVDFSEVEFIQGTVKVLIGSFLFNIELSEFIRSYSVESKGRVSLSDTGSNILSFENTKLSRTLNYEAGTYSIDSSGTVKRADFLGSYKFSQPKPWVGYIFELPYEGEVELTTSGDDIVKIKSNTGVDSELISVTNKSSEEKEFWASFAEGAFWSNIGDYNSAGQIFSTNNFRFIGVLNEQELDNFPLNNEIIIAFNRPIKDVVSTEIYLEERFFPHGKVEVVSEINGAILHITPKQPLKPEGEYVLPKLEISSISGVVASTLNNIKLVASLNVIPIITIQPNLFTYNDTPLLDASRSKVANGHTTNYQWLDISNSGVVFSSPNSVTTNFSVSDTLVEDIIIGLKVSNGVGDEALVETKVHNLEGVESFIAIDSEDGDFIGQGKRWLLTSNDGVFISQIGSSYLDYINIAYRGQSNWSLDLASPEEEALKVGKYSNVKGYPFQSKTEFGLRYQGDGRGCNNALGEFEVFEVEYDKSNNLIALAVNFTQRCKSSEPPLHGIVRYKSTYPIN